MKIGILGAMQEEIAFLLEKLENSEKHTVGKREFHTGMLRGHEVVLVFSRWGKVAAASTVTSLIDLFQVDIVLFTGIAGAVDRSLVPGDFVIADRLIQHDMDVSSIGGMERFEIPILGKKYFEVAPELVAVGLQAARDFVDSGLNAVTDSEVLREFNIRKPAVCSGTIASGDQFIASPLVTEALSRSVENLKCVEMEGAAIAQVAWEHAIPFMVFRTISDKADHTAHLDFPRFVSQVASHFTAGVILQLLTNTAFQEVLLKHSFCGEDQ